VDIDAALRLIKLGHLESAQALLCFASVELNDALASANYLPSRATKPMITSRRRRTSRLSLARM